MANLATPVTPLTVTVGQTGHDGLHTSERDYLETLRAKVSEQIDLADVSGAKVLLWSEGAVKDYRLIGNTTFSFPAAASAGVPAGGAGGQATSFTLRLRQDATGNRTVTWPSATFLKWPGGAAPALTTTASRVDWLTFITLTGGAFWVGFLAGKDVR